MSHDDDLENFSCRLIPVSGSNQENNFFDAYLSVDADRRNWYRKIFWGDDDKKFKVFVLCRTKDILDKLNILTNISIDNVELRKYQARNAGMVFCVIKVQDNFSMVYVPA